MTQDELAALDRAARESTEEQQLLWMRPATHRISTELLALYRAGRIAVIDKAPLKVGDVVCLPDGRQGPVEYIDEPRDPYIRMRYGKGEFDFYTCPASYVSRGVALGVKP